MRDDVDRQHGDGEKFRSPASKTCKLVSIKFTKVSPPVTTTHAAKARQKKDGLSVHRKMQTTAAFSPEMPVVLTKDTRPAFLGGSYKSKVQGVSEVSQYVKHSRPFKDS